YYIMMLLLQSGMIGAFVAADLFLFFIFWEVMLVPMYFLIGIWGGKNRLYSAIKFFLYTLVGSLVMLLAVLKLFFIFPDVVKAHRAEVEATARQLASSSLSGPQPAGQVNQQMLARMDIGICGEAGLAPAPGAHLPESNVKARLTSAALTPLGRISRQCSALASSSISSLDSRSLSPSRYRCSHFTRGCRTR